MSWTEQQLERMRSLDPRLVDGGLAAALLVLGLSTVFSQDLTGGRVEPDALTVLTSLLICAPVAIRRQAPLAALCIASAGIGWHVLASWPEGSLPLGVMVLTYTVAAYDTYRRAVAGLLVVFGTLIVLGVAEAPGLDAIGVLGNMATFTVAWALGIALKARREVLEARVREADERAKVERQTTARALAEERLRIAQELHDVVAHSMSVIAVQAGVGAHVLDDRPEQARAALEAISATSRGTLTELRRLLGVLRSDDGARSDAPAPGLADVPQLVDDVRKAGVPVSLRVDPAVDDEPCINAGVELSAYRVVQEALTNVIKHAGSPTHVDVTLQHLPGSLAVEVVDDGRGAAANHAAVPSGHGLVGMRERVELWGGELSAGPVDGGGYRVRALLPYGEEQ